MGQGERKRVKETEEEDGGEHYRSEGGGRDSHQSQFPRARPGGIMVSAALG